jgi:hypothetical protein
MNARRIVEIRETIEVRPGKFEESVYHFQRVKACPASSQINPYGEGSGGVAPETPARPPIARPSKAEYVRSLSADGDLPACVVARREETEARLGRIADCVTRTGRRMNARLSKALAWYDVLDLSCAYDTGRLARIHYHFVAQRCRAGNDVLARS